MSIDSIKTSLAHTFGLSSAEPKSADRTTGGPATLRTASSLAEVSIRQGAGQNRPASASSWKSEVSAFFKGILADARELKAGLSRDFEAFKADPKGFLLSLFGGRGAGEAAASRSAATVVADYRIRSNESLSSALKGAAEAGPEAGAGILDKIVASMGSTTQSPLSRKVDQAVFAELNGAATFDEAKTLIADFRDLVRDLDAAGLKTADHALFLDAIDKIEGLMTDQATSVTALNDDFAREFPAQVASPGTFFRSSEATNVSLTRVVKNDSPAFLAKVDTAYRNALAKLESHPLREAAKADFEQGSGAPQTRDRTSGLPVRQEIALQLTTELFAEVFGTDDGGRAAFADLLGRDTKVFLGAADASIRAAFDGDARVQKEVLDKWNSNNLILRGSGKVNSDLTKEIGKPFENGILTMMHSMITSAAGGVTVLGKSHTDYRTDARYTTFIATVSDTLSDITRNHMI